VTHPFKKTLIGIGLIAAAFLSSCGDDSNGAVATVPTATPTVAALTSTQVLQVGPFAVGSTTMTLVDTTRPTMPNRTFPGAASRTLVTELWYPTDAQPSATPEIRNAPLAHSGAPYPLVIYSHGFMSNRFGGTYLARHLASHGYVVGAADFPLSVNGAPGGPNFLDLANQPGDVRFVIDQLLALSTNAQSSLAGSVDSTRIGLTGLSMGGSTTFLATFHPMLRDPRVRAAAPMAGVACFFGPDFYAQTHVPLLIVHGDIDAVVPYQGNGVFAFGEANPPKYLVTIAAGSHTGFTSGIETIFENVNNPDDIGCRALGGPTGNVASPTLIDSLGGAAAGIVGGMCPEGCASATLPRSIRPSRQQQLTILSIFPFFEGYLRDDAQARQFLEHTLAAENSELTTQLQLAGH
jgi:predicted dienelactone hydrolase